MLNISSCKVCSVVVAIHVIVLAMLFFCVSYAVTTTNDITIECSGNLKKSWQVPWYEIKGEPNTIFVLTTKGLQVSEEKFIGFDDYLRDFGNEISSSSCRSIYSSSNVNILAVCTSSLKQVRYVDMWPPGTSISCKKGEGLEVSVVIKKQDNFDVVGQCKYVATLKKISDDEDKISKANNTLAGEGSIQQKGFIDNGALVRGDFAISPK